MVNQLLLLSSAERLPAFDKAEGEEKYFLGWTYSVALMSGAWDAPKTAFDAGLSFLRPWSWNDKTLFAPIEKLIVFRREGSAESWERCPDVALGNHQLQIPDNFKLYLKGLNEIFDDWKREKAHLVWSNGSFRVSSKLKFRPWSAFVAELSLQPYPIAQLLKLSHSCLLPEWKPGGSESENEEILVFPVLRVRQSDSEAWDELTVSDLPDANGQVTYDTAMANPRLAAEEIQVVAMGNAISRREASGSPLSLIVSDLRVHSLDWRMGLEERGATSPTRETRGISLQVADLGESFEGILSRFRGAGVLVRRKGTGGQAPGAWHCLNMAMPQVRTGSGNDDYRDLGEVVVLPSRLAYVDGIGNPVLTWNNGPMTAPSPIGSREATGWEITQKQGEVKAPLLRFERDPRARMPGLAFGQSYEFLAFRVSNSGALPRALAQPEAPWQLDLGGFEARRTSDGWGTVAIEYKRLAHVGAIRFTRIEESHEIALRDGMPEIPPNVSPRARELVATEILPSKDSSWARGSEPHAQLPLVLLSPSGFPLRDGLFVPSRFRFDLRCPAIDLETWDRWMAAEYLTATGDLAKRGVQDKRRSTRTASYVLSHLDGSGAEADERALDDPAVRGLWLELVQIAGTGSYASSVRTFWPAPTTEPLTSFEMERCSAYLTQQQHPSIRVDCSVRDDASRLEIAGNEVKVSVLPGRVYRLTAYAVLVGSAQGRFADAEDVRVEDGLKLTSPSHLLLEVAVHPRSNRPLPISALDAVFDDKLDQLRVTLTPPALLSDGQEFPDLFSRAEVLQQIWDWRGRPPMELPENLQKLSDRLPFEMSEFGDRSDDEHRRRPMRPKFTRGRITSFVYQETIPRSGPLADPRQQYHRLSARLYSRYEGLLDPDIASWELFEEDQSQPSGFGDNRWTPALVPCRFAGDVPPPNVKMVLPLTGGVPTIKASPGLLVVVDGPWYEVGGLGDSLEVELISVLSPDCNPDLIEERGADGQPTQEARKCVYYYQIGTDPVLTAESIGKMLGIGENAVRKSEKSVAIGVKGAIGLQRDSSRTSPYFLASSFVLSQPQIQGQADVDLSWAFLELRFRRVLKGYRDSGTTLTSEFTMPFWVQLLPAMARVEKDYFADADPGSVFTVLNGEITRDQAFSQVEEHAFLVGLITRLIRDASGTPQEAFQCLAFPASESPFKWKVEDGASLERGPLLVRWMVVQQRRPFGTERKLKEGETMSIRFWKELFDTSTRDSERSRILRMSGAHSLEVR